MSGAPNSLLTDSGEPEPALRPRWLRAFDPQSYVLVRFVFLRLLGVIYAVAFLVAVNQLLPLVGSGGLEPGALFLDNVKRQLGSGTAYLRLPTLFWLGASDMALAGASFAGLLLSLGLLLGIANSITLFLLWVLYLSIVQVGQIFWGYGWESLLLETGFLAIFLAPPFSLGTWAWPRRATRGEGAGIAAGLRSDGESPPRVVIWLLRWLAFRLMLGAGLIKLRGDPCWRDLTCLYTHYETQPLPNPLSWYFHQLPHWVQRGGVLFNHYAELVAPFMVFGPRTVRLLGGASIVAFQLVLILSGNLSWLNWLTIVVTLSCFDDRALLRLCPRRFRIRLAPLARAAPLSKARRIAVAALAVLVGVLSINPVANLFSSEQVMNSSFDPLYLVNTYGAFGGIGRERYEIILEGTSDDDPTDEGAHWLPYEFRCKPGDLTRRPCVVAPYQYRIDWQMWFAAMSDYRHHPWIVHFVYKLLLGDHATLGLLDKNPFPERPPRYVRASLFRYQFTDFSDKTGAYWQRTEAGTYLPALSADDPALLEFLRRHQWGGR
jgi:Lipase maturation factor